MKGPSYLKVNYLVLSRFLLSHIEQFYWRRMYDSGSVSIKYRQGPDLYSHMKQSKEPDRMNETIEGFFDMYTLLYSLLIYLFIFGYAGPQDWKRSVFIPIPKKGNAKECSNDCTIALISHISTDMLKILQIRLQQYVNHEISRCPSWI